MILAGLVALVVSIVYSVAGPRLAADLPPAVATRFLAVTALVVAGSTALVLGLLGFTAVAQLPRVAQAGSWSVPELQAVNPVPLTVAVLSGLAGATILIRTALVLTGRCAALIAVRRTCRGSAPGSLIVLDSERADAFAAGGTGQIVVTTALLRALSADQRRALLAHERSHLRHRHAWWITIADVAAAGNPLLRPTARAVAQATERWADEDAAGEVGDRRLVARTIARAALLRRTTADPAVLAALGGDVPARVRALLAPPVRLRARLLVVLVVLMIVSAVAAVVVQKRTDAMLDKAAMFGTPPAGAQQE